MEARVSRITKDLLPNTVLNGIEPQRRSLEERMSALHVPGLSVAVVDGGRIDWIRAYGVADAELDTPVTEHTLFETGSIYKAVNATVALRLMDHGQLDLDDDVKRYLRTWKVPESEYTQNEKVTLRRLLSHTAGFNATDFVGRRTEASEVTLAEMLEGKFAVDSRAARVESVPGAAFRYSNAGAMVAQLVLQDLTGKPLDQLASREVFAPLGMKDTTYRLPLPPDWEVRTAAAHDAAGGRYAGRYTEPIPTTHLWSTPTDLLKWAMAITASSEGRGHFLSRSAARAMLTPVMAGQPAAVGTFVGGENDDISFGHGGRTEGASAEVRYYPARGQGAAVMVNSDAGAYLVPALLGAIGREYGWPGAEPRPADFKPTPPELLREAVGSYTTEYPVSAALRLAMAGESLFVECFKLAIRSRAVLVGKNRFVTVDEGVPFLLAPTEPGRVHAVDLGGGWRFTRVEPGTDAAQLGH